MAGQSDNFGELRYQIEMQVQAIRLAPGDVRLHQKLRRLGLAYRAAGGKPPGFLECMRVKAAERAGGDLVERLGRSERLWAMDPGNVDYALWVLRILREMEEAGGYSDVGEVARWVEGILKRANGM